MDEEDYSGWSLHDRPELLPFEARLAGVPLKLVAAICEVVDCCCSGMWARSRSALATRSLLAGAKTGAKPGDRQQTEATKKDLAELAKSFSSNR
jgi:hypothetical protein